MDILRDDEGDTLWQDHQDGGHRTIRLCVCSLNNLLTDLKPHLLNGRHVAKHAHATLST